MPDFFFFVFILNIHFLIDLILNLWFPVKSSFFAWLDPRIKIEMIGILNIVVFQFQFLVFFVYRFHTD